MKLWTHCSLGLFYSTLAQRHQGWISIITTLCRILSACLNGTVHTCRPPADDKKPENIAVKGWRYVCEGVRPCECKWEGTFRQRPQSYSRTMSTEVLTNRPTLQQFFFSLLILSTTRFSFCRLQILITSKFYQIVRVRGLTRRLSRCFLLWVEFLQNEDIFGTYLVGFRLVAHFIPNREACVTKINQIHRGEKIG